MEDFIYEGHFFAVYDGHGTSGKEVPLKNLSFCYF